MSIIELLSQFMVYQNRRSDENGEKLLHLACDTCYAEHFDSLLATIHLLFEADAVPNERDDDVNGPLYVLVVPGSFSIIMVIV